jgi:hypothetical protein
VTQGLTVTAVGAFTRFRRSVVSNLLGCFSHAALQCWDALAHVTHTHEETQHRGWSLQLRLPALLVKHWLPHEWTVEPSKSGVERVESSKHCVGGRSLRTWRACMAVELRAAVLHGMLKKVGAYPLVVSLTDASVLPLPGVCNANIGRGGVSVHWPQPVILGQRDAMAHAAQTGAPTPFK